VCLTYQTLSANLYLTRLNNFINLTKKANYMKTIFFFLMAVSSVKAYECAHFMKDQGKVETLTHTAVEVLKYDSLGHFCTEDQYLDLELNFMPNYFKYREENDDHYKLMIHYAYKSCTFIYNSTKKFVTDKRCYSTW